MFSWLIVYLYSRVGEEIGVQNDMTKRDIFMAGVSNSHTCGSHKKEEMLYRSNFEAEKALRATVY